MPRFPSFLAGLVAAGFALLLMVPTAFAVAPIDFPPEPPDEVVIDSAGIALDRALLERELAAVDA